MAAPFLMARRHGSAGIRLGMSSGAHIDVRPAPIAALEKSQEEIFVAKRLSNHPVTISPAEGRVRVTVAGRIVAESTKALRLEEKGYPPIDCLPRSGAGMPLLVRTALAFCPARVDAIEVIL